MKTISKLTEMAKAIRTPEDITSFLGAYKLANNDLDKSLAEAERAIECLNDGINAPDRKEVEALLDACKAVQDDLRESLAIAEDAIECFGDGVNAPIPTIRPNTSNGIYNRVEVTNVCSIRTRGIDLFNSYVLHLTDDYALSIITGSHPDSAERQTFEIALMRNGLFAFGDEDTDASIIPHVNLDEAVLMLAQMRRHPQEIESIFLRHR